MSAAGERRNSTIKINPREGIKFFPFQRDRDRGTEIYDFKNIGILQAGSLGKACRRG
jgi:hypothetical protein